MAANTDKNTKGLARTPLKLGKKFRFLEVVVEGIIKSLSFLSIAAIVLIFVFVFKEASPVFFAKKEAPKDSTALHSGNAASPSSDSGGLKQEVYDPLAPEEKKAPTEPAPKTTKRDKVSFVDKSKVAQEVYDPLADDEPAEPVKKEEKEIAKAPVVTPAPAKKKEKISFADKSKVSQEVYDPLADDAPTDKNAKTATTQTPDTVAVPVVALTPAETAAEKAEADSAAAQEVGNEELRKHASNFFTMLTGTNWQPVSDVPKFGFVPLFFGTLKVTLLALLFAAPIAILAALFTSSFAPKWAREIIKPVIELLAGFPSVVIGFFALIVLATFFQDMFHYTFRLNSFVGGIAMAFAVIPIIYTISEDALMAVPQQLRDGSTALGATRWQTAFKIVLPAALPGVFAAVVLGFGRAFGETMIALMATGNAPLSSANILEPVRTFAATIGAEMAEVVFGDEHYNVLFLIGAMLFVFTFLMNMLVEFYIRKRLIKRIQGK